MSLHLYILYKSSL